MMFVLRKKKIQNQKDLSLARQLGVGRMVGSSTGFANVLEGSSGGPR